MIRIEVTDGKARALFSRINLLVEDRAFDQPVEIAAFRSMAELIVLTPKKWTGMLRRKWMIKKPADGQRLVFNDSKVMLFLEEGTGKSTGGYIYPKTKKFLFVPLTARAAIGGWSAALKYGVDYVLARRVRGITARHIVKNFRPRAREILKHQMKAFLEKHLK